MTTNTEALRAQFEAWATAQYRLSFDDDTPLKRYLWVAYQSGYAAAKAETATSRLEIEMSNKSSKVSNES